MTVDEKAIQDARTDAIMKAYDLLEEVERIYREDAPHRREGRLDRYRIALRASLDNLDKVCKP